MSQDKKSANKNRNQTSDTRGDIGKSIERTESGRAPIRKHRNMMETRREAERQNGSFYLRTNAGRSNDLYAALDGQIGDYAFPGGDQPSTHLNVQKEVGRLGAMAVLRLETIQYGHDLQHEIFDPNIFLPCYFVKKSGLDFCSRLSERLSSTTQELICHYLAMQLQTSAGVDDSSATQDIALESVPEPIMELTPETFEQALSRSNKSMEDLLAGKPDLYGHETVSGAVLVDCFIGGPRNLPCIEVTGSTHANVVASDAFLLVHNLRKVTLDRSSGVSDDLYQQMHAIHAFFRNEFKDLLTKQPEVPILNAQKQPGKKEQKKLVWKKAMKIAEATARASEESKVANMKKGAISIREAAMSGKPGWVDLSNKSGDLIVLFGTIGVDKVIQVNHIDKAHMLRLAGVDEGSKVYLGQILKGEVDRMDQLNHRLSSEQVKTANALIGYIRDKLTEAHIKLHKLPTPSLRLVA